MNHDNWDELDYLEYALEDEDGGYYVVAYELDDEDDPEEELDDADGAWRPPHWLTLTFVVLMIAALVYGYVGVLIEFQPAPLPPPPIDIQGRF